MIVDSMKDLSRAEKILILNDLWDDLATDEAQVELSEENKRTLDERWQLLHEDPGPGDPWKMVKDRIAESL